MLDWLISVINYATFIALLAYTSYLTTFKAVPKAQFLKFAVYIFTIYLFIGLSSFLFDTFATIQSKLCILLICIVIGLFNIWRLRKNLQ